MTKREAAIALHSVINNLSERDASFAHSLLDSLDRHGDLSQNQWFWVVKLTQRANGEDRATAPRGIQVGDFAGVIALFQRAVAAKLKHPKIKLQLADGAPVALAVAGSASKAPGTINVTDGRPFGRNVWFGRVHPDGRWEPSQQVEAGRQAEVTALLQQLAANPAEVAALYGRRTGSCCFCARELTDARSVSVGYGPICADKFGLPWGESKVALTCEGVA
jgi:hypothetical protein